MLLIGLGIGLIIAGLVALIKGRLSLTKTRVVQGVPARLLGVALMTPLPLGFLAATVYTLMNVNPNDQQQMNQWAQNNEMNIALVMAAVEIGLALLIFVIAAFLAKPITQEPKRRPSSRDDGDYDDFEDRPRRKRPAEDDERPRRRQDDLDERSR